MATTKRYVPPDEHIIFVRHFRNRYTGKVIYASQFGLKAFPIRVKK